MLRFILSLSLQLISVIISLFRREVLGYTAHSPVKSDKALEDVLGNLNLSSTVTPQMINLGLSQERKLSDVTLLLCCHGLVLLSVFVCTNDIYGSVLFSQLWMRCGTSRPCSDFCSL